MEKGHVLCRGNDGYEPPKEWLNKALAAQPQSVTFEYQRKLRKAFNPNNLGDTYYQAFQD